MDQLKDGSQLSVDQLAAATHIPPSEVTSTLMMMELKFQVVKRLDGKYEAQG